MLPMLAVALSACVTVTPNHVALADKARDAITSTEIVEPIRQSEIYIYVPPSQIATAGGGGLLLALIDAGVDSARTSNAEAAVKGLRNSVVDFNFDETLTGDLRDSVSQVSWLHLNGARVIKEIEPASLDGAISQSKAGAVLLTWADYHLSNNGRELYVVLNAGLYANSDGLKPYQPVEGKSDVKSAPGNALYRNSFMFTTTLVGATDKRVDNMALWSADGGARARAALKLGAAKVARLLADDLQGKLAAPADAKPNAEGQAIADETGGTIQRHGDGTIVYTGRPVS